MSDKKLSPKEKDLLKKLKSDKSEIRKLENDLQRVYDDLEKKKSQKFDKK